MQKTIFWLLAATLALPGLYPLAKALPTAAIPMVLACSTLLLYTILNHNPLRPILSTSWPSSLLISGLSISTIFFHQPIPTFLPTAWNTLLHPLATIGILPLITPLSLAFLIFAMRTTQHPWLQINRFTLALFTCFPMWPDGAADLPALGLLILSLVILITRQRIAGMELSAIILLLATITTARAALIYLPLLLSFSLVAVWPKRALTVALGSAALLFLFKPNLPILPTDIFTSTSLTALILLTIVTIQSIYHWRWWPAHQHAAWGLAAPFFVIALHNLSETASFSLWYGAIYLTLALPVITYTLLRPTFKHR